MTLCPLPYDLSVDGQPRVKDLGVSHPESLVQPSNSLDILLAQIQSRALQVLDHSLRLDRLGNDDDVSLSTPSKENLAGSGVVLFGDLGDHGMGEQGFDLCGRGDTQFQPAVEVGYISE